MSFLIEVAAAALAIALPVEALRVVLGPAELPWVGLFRAPGGDGWPHGGYGWPHGVQEDDDARFSWQPRAPLPMAASTPAPVGPPDGLDAMTTAAAGAWFPGELVELSDGLVEELRPASARVHVRCP
jgi:hypothetical protein